MADVVLFHHVLGLTEGVLALADDLRAAGHDVETPDLFDGHTFTSIEQGAAHVDELGFDEIISRGVTAADPLPPGLVYAGISLGAVPAQKLALTRPGARGAFLLEACVPPAMFDAEWPPALPLQIHGMDHDPFFAGEGDLDTAHALVDAVGAELFVYAGDRHLFTDRSLASYDGDSTKLVVARIIDLLGRVDAEPGG